MRAGHQGREGGRKKREQENYIIKFGVSEMERIEFGVHEIKGRNTSFLENCPTEIFAQGGQSHIYNTVDCL